MKLRGSLFFSLALIGVIVIGAYYPQPASESGKETILMQTVLGGLRYWHFSPITIDDEFSEKAYDLYIDRIDGGRRFLTEVDLKKMEKYRSTIDEETEEGTYEFFNLSVELLDASILKTEAYYKEILSRPFDFTLDEKIELDNEKKDFAKNDKELKDYWRKSLKYETLNRLIDKLEKQNNNEDENAVKKSVAELEEEARTAVLKSFDNWYKRMKKLRRSDRLSSYLNAITGVFDPHTTYYKPKDKEDFDIRMSGTLEGIGARLQEDDDYIKVLEIIPGGPAWKQKELEANDLITKVTQDGEEPIDVVGWRIDDVVKMIRGKKGTKVTLTIKKPDGLIKEITITRDVVIIDESYAKSVLIDYKGSASNIGYIHLPQFYSDFTGNGGPRCADDVANEIEKLKKQNVQGIILDLRNNTGGSLDEVVKMSGLFIEEGPIVQVKGRQGPARVLADDDPSVLYDGPLIVMVNSFSASASEILAAALQDYGRAVIIGSKTTFGKGTVQSMFDLDRAVRGHSEVKPLGSMKITRQKFYRINGGSTQLKGVTPDIILPDNYSYTVVGEQDHEFPMQWSEISAVPYDHSVADGNALQFLEMRSKSRVSKSPVFNKVVENAKRLKDREDLTAYTLQFEKYKKLDADRQAEADQYKEIFQPIEALSVKNLDQDLAKINMDESKQARNEDWIKSLQKDTYLEEALFIMKDMLEMD